MKLETLLQEQKEIACILPVYEKHLGDATKIILEEGEYLLLPRSIDATIKAIATYYALHLRLLRKKQQRLLNAKNYLPLPFHRNLLLFPIKTRVPKVKKDSSTGYINYFHVKKIDTKQNTIHLHNDSIIPSLNGSATLKKRYHEADLTAKFYEAENAIAMVKESPMDQYMPATKEDMRELKKEVRYLRGIVDGLEKPNPSNEK